MNIFREEQINNAEVKVSGRGNRTVRLVCDGQEGGFATTTYSYSMSDPMKEYSAERIALLMILAKGKTNGQIASLLNNSTSREAAIKALPSL